MAGRIEYEFHLQGHLSERWAAWFEGLTVEPLPNGDTVLRGLLTDQAALHGVLDKIRNLNLVLISLHQVKQDE